MFKICEPDANNFSKIVEFKSVDQIDYEYVSLDKSKDIGYWSFESPFVDYRSFEIFKKSVSNFPICKNNNLDNNFDPNPFDTIHIPAWLHKDICILLRDFYVKQFHNGYWSLEYALTQFKNPSIFEWGNVYYKEKSRPILAHRIPHRDYDKGLVGNLWFTNHNKGTSGTKFYKYIGNDINGEYEFAVNTDHKLYKEYQNLLKKGRNDSWFNFDYKELEKWGFEYLGMADCKENTMTVYRSNICHLAFIEEEVDFRWSHTFAFAHR